MKPYNGFAEAQRNKAQSWLNKQWEAGVFAKPAQCCSCDQTKGVIDAHAEDYSEPFMASKTDQFHLCYRCHMMLHCRFRNQGAFARYCTEVAKGIQYEPFYVRNFPSFVKQHFDNWRPTVSSYTANTTNVLANIHARIPS